MAKIDYIWSDRKRILGMPITFTRYSLSNDRLFLETGLLSTRCEDILLYRVRDISLSITLGQRLFGVGTITIHSSDKTLPTLEIKNVKAPRDTKEIIHEAVEEMKLSRRMRVGEILSGADSHDDDDDDDWDDEDFS